MPPPFKAYVLRTELLWIEVQCFIWIPLRVSRNTKLFITNETMCRHLFPFSPEMYHRHVILRLATEMESLSVASRRKHALNPPSSLSYLTVEYIHLPKAINVGFQGGHQLLTLETYYCYIYTPFCCIIRLRLVNSK